MDNNRTVPLVPLLLTLSILLACALLTGCTGDPARPATPQRSTGVPASPPGTEIPAQQPQATDAGSDRAAGQVSEATGPLDVTIHSAIKTEKVQTAKPMPGRIFIVINMTIENLDETKSYALNETTLKITGGGPLNQKMYGYLTNPIYWGSIPARGTMTGEVVFGVRESTKFFTLTFLDGAGKSAGTKEIGSIPEGSYASFLEDPALFDSTNFSYVVDALDTPAEAFQYANAKFTFRYHDGCTAYPPEEFFERQVGDCKDYATFLSYVLAHHGYDAKIIAFSYAVEEQRKGHVVTLFTDTDGTLKYVTTPDVRIMRNVTSFEDLLKKECSRLGTAAVIEHRIQLAGSVDACVP